MKELKITDMDSRRYLMPGLLLLGMYLAFPSCYYDAEEELYPFSFCDTTSIPSYTQKVIPILQQHCIGCHGGGSPSAGVSLDNYAGVKIKGDDGKLSCSINHNSGCSPMPDNAPQLIPCDIQVIERWILNGAQND